MNDAKSKKPIWLWAIPVVVVAIVVAMFASTMAQASLDDSEAAKSEEYTADLTLASLSVALQENGVTCAQTGVEGATANYTGLLADLNGGLPLSFGKHYDESLAAYNDGTQDEYVRVVVNRYWKDDAGKGTQLDPAFIELDFDESNWIVVDDPDAKEQVILYSVRPLAPGESLPFVTGIGISADVLGVKDIVPLALDGTSGSFVTTHYDYESYKLGLDVEVSSVQTHSAADAIKSAWGIDAANVQGTGRAIGAAA